MPPTTDLPTPVVPPRATAPSWRTAWDQALYGRDGFFRREFPARHFRTAVHGSDLMARALLALCRRHGLDTVVDVGAGGGELLRALHLLAPDLDLLGVEVAGRPADVPSPIGWTPALPTEVDGLLVAHEWLDNVPCHVVEVDESGVPRMVHVDPATGTETLGLPVRGDGVPSSVPAWLDRWWPLDGAPPGTRAEVGTSRDLAWAEAVARVRRGSAVAIDYGHVAGARPGGGSLRSFRNGREVPPVPDGTRDLTAQVAVDSVAAAVGARVLRQREALAELGVDGRRPDRYDAETDPAGYLDALRQAGEAAALTRGGPPGAGTPSPEGPEGPESTASPAGPAGPGDFYWVVSSTGL